MTTNHTPTPLRLLTKNGHDDCMIINALGGRVADVYTVRGGEFIVTACNAHDELVAALAELVERCDGNEGVRGDGSNIQTMRAHAILAKVQS